VTISLKDGETKLNLTCKGEDLNNKLPEPCCFIHAALPAECLDEDEQDSADSIPGLTSI